LHTQKCANTISVFSYLYGETVAQALVAVSSTLGQFKISGYISRETHHQKNLQFVYVNKRLILKSKLHKLANSMLGNSFLLKTNTTSRDIPISKEISTGRWLAFSPPRKRDKYAVYLLNVECPYHIYDVCFDPKKTLIEFSNWDNVLQCMELAIRTFLEKEYHMTLSEQSCSHSLQEKNNDSNILSVLEELEQVEEECTVAELRVQNPDPSDMLDQEKNSDMHGLSENVSKKMLDVSRAVFGVPAKRRAKNEGTCCRDDLRLRSAAVTLEETEVESEITIILDSGAHRSKQDVLTNFTSETTLCKCDSENPYPSLETYSAPRLNRAQKTGVLKEKVARRNLNHLIGHISDIPVTESDSETLSVQCMFTKTNSDLYPIERFRNYISKRIQPEYHSKQVDIPPITKFRETFHCVSNVEIPMPFKNFEWHALNRFLIMSGLLKKGVNLTNKCDKSNVTTNLKDVPVGDYETTQQGIHAHNGDGGSSFHTAQTNVKCLLGERTDKQTNVSNECKKVYTREHTNCALYADHSLQQSSLQNVSKSLSDVNVTKPITVFENTQNKGADIFDFERTFSQYSTNFSDELLMAKSVSNACSSASYKRSLCKDFNTPHREVIEVEECVQFQLPNDVSMCGQNQRETRLAATKSNVPVRSCLKASDVAHDNERSGFKLFHLTSTTDVKNVKEYMHNIQKIHSTHKKDKYTDGRAMFSLIQNNNQVHNQLKHMHPEINMCTCYTKTYRKDDSFSRNYCTNYDFLHTLEREEAKKNKCTAQNSMSVCLTNFQDEHSITKTSSCYENLHNVPAYRKSVRFNCTDKRVFNSNYEGKTVQLFTSPESSPCVLHSVNVAEECVRPDFGAVTFRFSPKVEMRHQSGCRNILKTFSSNSDVLCGDKLMKDMQRAEFVRNHCMGNCAKRISQVVLSSNSAVFKRQLGNNMILTSGSEADVESSNDTVPCPQKKRRLNVLSFNNTRTEKGRFSKLPSKPEYSYTHEKVINNSHFEKCLKQKICYSVNKSWNRNELSKQQHNGEACMSFQEQEKSAGCLSSDRQGSRSSVVDKSPLMSVEEGVPHILDDSSNTIVPSSGSCCDLLSHFSNTANCKMIVSDSDSDISLHDHAVTGNIDPGYLPCVQNRLTVSSNGNTTENQDHCSRSFSHEIEEGKIIAETSSICIPFGQGSSEVETRTVGVPETHVCREKSVENVCTELSTTVLLDVIDTLRIICISDFPSKENCARTLGNESHISEVENVNSGDESNIVSPKVTVIQEVSESCNSLVNNSTVKLDDTMKNNFGDKCFENELLFSKQPLESDTIKCGMSVSNKGIEDEASQLSLMESTSGQGQLLCFRGLSQSNAQHCGMSAVLNCSDGGSTHVLTREEGPGVGRLACDSELSLSVQESKSKNKKVSGASDTFSLAKKNNTVIIRDTFSNSGRVPNGPNHSSVDDRLESRNNLNHGVLAADNFTDDGSAHTLRQDSVLNSESSACVQQYETLSFCKSTKGNDNDASRLSNNVKRSDREHGSDIMHSDFITSEQITHVNATESDGKFSVLSKNLEAGKKQNLNELLHAGACTVTNGWILSERRSDLLDRKRRSDGDCLDTHGKRSCTEQPNENVSMHKCKPCNNNIAAPEVYMSDSISTQDLNEALDNIMKKIAESDTNKKENCAFTVGQGDVAADTLGNKTVETDMQKESHNIKCNSKDISLKCPKGWEQKLDPKGKVFFVHVETGLTSYTIPSQVKTQNLYSMSKRFAFLPKGMSPVLQNTVKKSNKDSEENTLTPVSHQALCNVITDSYSLVDELAVVKWKDVQEKKETGKIIYIMCMVCHDFCIQNNI